MAVNQLPPGLQAPGGCYNRPQTVAIGCRTTPDTTKEESMKNLSIITLATALTLGLATLSPTPPAFAADEPTMGASTNLGQEMKTLEETQRLEKQEMEERHKRQREALRKRIEKEGSEKGEMKGENHQHREMKEGDKTERKIREEHREMERERTERTKGK